MTGPRPSRPAPGLGDSPMRAERLLIALALLTLAVLFGEAPSTVVGSRAGW